MGEQMEKLMELAKQNEALQAKLVEISRMEEKDMAAAIIAVAKEQGIELSQADFAEKKAGELVDDALDTVSGGTSIGAPGGLGDFFKDWFIRTVDKFDIPKMPTVDPSDVASQIPTVDTGGIKKGDFDKKSGGTYFC